MHGVLTDRQSSGVSGMAGGDDQMRSRECPPNVALPSRPVPESFPARDHADPLDVDVASPLQRSHEPSQLALMARFAVREAPDDCAKAMVL